MLLHNLNANTSFTSVKYISTIHFFSCFLQVFQYCAFLQFSTWTNCTSHLACFLTNLNFATVWKVCFTFFCIILFKQIVIVWINISSAPFYMYNIRKMPIAMLTRCWPSLWCRWCKWNETCGHDVDQHFDVDDVNKKERVRYRHDIEFNVRCRHDVESISINIAMCR